MMNRILIIDLQGEGYRMPESERIGKFPKLGM
jgi:hypothetical protein